jgi:HAD superfamily hydrolase (TIGR01509 family)
VSLPRANVTARKYNVAVLRAVLFDFDGLILDTETPEVQILKEVFAEHGQEFPDEYWIQALGRGADQLMDPPMILLQKMCGKEMDCEALERERRKKTVALIELEPIRPGVQDLLLEIKERGLKAGIASSSKHPWVDGHLERLGLLGLFDKIVCADDVARAKPHPDLYQELVGELGVGPDECFALEDSPNGIKGAKAAGLKVVAVETPLSRKLDLSDADVKVATLAGMSLDELWALCN